MSSKQERRKVDLSSTSWILRTCRWRINCESGWEGCDNLQDHGLSTWFLGGAPSAPFHEELWRAAQNNIILRPVTRELTEDLRIGIWKHFALHAWESVGVSEDGTANQPDAGDVNGLSAPGLLRSSQNDLLLCVLVWGWRQEMEWEWGIKKSHSGPTSLNQPCVIQYNFIELWILLIDWLR